MIELIAYLAPVLVLLALLAIGRYPGEQAAARRIADRPGRGPRPAIRVARPTRPLIELPRGGALLAAGLAGRAPPVVPR